MGSAATALTFSVEGLSVREELVVKSFIRLLGQRTLHQWHYQVQSADLRLVAEALVRNTPAPDHATGTRVPVLVLGHLSTASDAYLRLPLRADELQRALDREGTLIAQTAQLKAATNKVWATHPVQLLHWPPTHLLSKPYSVRLATLLAVKPITLLQLQARSGCTAAQCAECLAALDAAGLLRSFPDAGLRPGSGSHAAEAAAASFLSSTSSTPAFPPGQMPVANFLATALPHSDVSTPPTASRLSAAGLFARIRRALKIG